MISNKILGLALTLLITATLIGGYFLGRFSVTSVSERGNDSPGMNYSDLLSTVAWTIKTNGTWYWATNQNGSVCFTSLVCTDVWNGIISEPNRGTILVGTGREYFTSTVVVPSNVQIVGINEVESIIQRTGNFPIFALNTTEGQHGREQSYDIIRDLYLDGGGFSAPLIYCSQLKCSTFTELVLTNFIGNGMIFTGLTSNVSFSFWNHISYITVDNLTGPCSGSVLLFTGSSWDDYDVNNIVGYYDGSSQAPDGITFLGGGSCTFSNIFLTNFHNLFNIIASESTVYGIHITDCFANRAVAEGLVIDAKNFDIWDIQVNYCRFDGSPDSILPLILLQAQKNNAIYACSFDHNSYALGTYNPSITNALYSYAIMEKTTTGGHISQNTFSYNNFPAGSTGIYSLTSEDYKGISNDAHYNG